LRRTIEFNLNGAPVSCDVDDQRKLLWVLRDDLALMGTKYGCGEGICGACAVVIDGKAHRACLTPMDAVAGAQILTVEGLARNGVLHPLQQAFIDHGAFQCGYCTPGMLIDAYALLQQHPQPSRDEIIASLDGNLCRCGAHQRIIAAVEQASGQPVAP
jgi:aerobic-type carbon monoxide dehydrogenase small subunit (CoxS/CutS family)